MLFTSPVFQCEFPTTISNDLVKCTNLKFSKKLRCFRKSFLGCGEIIEADSISETVRVRSFGGSSAGKMKKAGKSGKKPSAVAVKRKIEAVRRDCCTQTDLTKQEDLELITADEPPPKYWRVLAEKRLKMIEELVTENEKLQDKVEYLENENRLLENMLEDAKDLAEYISALPEDPDESGIERG